MNKLGCYAAGVLVIGLLFAIFLLFYISNLQFDP